MVVNKNLFICNPTYLTSNSMMTNTPLTSNDYGKLFVFTLLLLVSAALLPGVIPLSFILFGLFMLRRTKDFSHIETASRNSKIYCWMFLLGFIIAIVYAKVEVYFEQPSSGDIVAYSVFVGIAAAYILAIHYLFLSPLRRHREWILQNGILFYRSKEQSKINDGGNVEIIKGERLHSFSVADELLKWAKLKEEGYISEQEFDEARAKLLRKS